MIRRAPGWLLAALLLAALLWPPAAGAHSLLIDSSLPDGAVLDAPPAEVVLRFSEPINPAFSSVTLYAESGVDIGLARPQFPAADTLRVALPEIMRPGSYTLAYKVLSGADGHVGYGSLLFSVGTGAPPVAAGVQLPTLAGPAPERVLARWLQLGAALVALGGLIWLLALFGPAAATHQFAAGPLLAYRAGWRIQAALVCCLIGTAAEFALRATEAAGRPSALLSIDALAPLIATGWGGLAVARLLLLLLAMPLALLASRVSRAGWLAAGLLALVMLTFSASGHAAGAAIPALAIGADWVHQLAGAAWLGGLLGLTGLVWQTRRLPADERRPLLASLAGRFSRLALWSVALVVATGVLRSFDHLPTLAAVWQTPYGRTLLLKTGLLAAALGFGAFHWRRIGRAPAGHLAGANAAAPARGRFGRTLAAESALAAGVLVVASALVQTPHPVTAASRPPARPEIITFSPLTLEASQGVPGDALTIALSLDDRRPGLRAFSVTVADAAGRPVAADRVRLRFKAKEIELGEEALILERQADGVWAGMSEAIRTLGRWELEVQVRRLGQPDVLALFDVEITR